MEILLSRLDVVILGLLLVASNLFWAIIALKLVNRIMSRTYFEYVQAQELKKTPMPTTVSDEMYFDPTDAKQAQEMNSLIGVI